MRRRTKQGAARLDMAALRKLIQKQIPMSTALGVVRKFPGEDSHFEIQIDDTGRREVMVDVELQPRSERVLCRLGFGFDQVYRIPRVNQEVAILIPNQKDSLIGDELDVDGIIVAVLNTDAPEELEDDFTVVISAARCIVTSDTIMLGKNPVPLAKQADLDALAAHVDTLLVGGSGSAPSAPGTAPSGSGTEHTTAS